MFCYQPNFFSQCEVMTPERFAQLIVSDAVTGRIRDYRAKLPELDRLKQEIKTREDLIAANPEPKSQLNAGLEGEIKKLQAQCRAITSIKSGLPVLMYQATFDKTVSKKGYEGYWRKQSAARLNGLFMLDVDHLASPLPPPTGGEASPLPPPTGGGDEKVRNVLGEGKGDPTPTEGGTPPPSGKGGEKVRNVLGESKGDSTPTKLGLPLQLEGAGGEALPNMNLSPRELYAKIRREHPELFSSPEGRIEGGTILLVHVTPSGRGLRIVAMASAERGNIADNQAWLSTQLGVEPDTACKDASRCSFCPGFEDILFIDKERLFTYENKAYDEKWGWKYKSLPPAPSNWRGGSEVRKSLGESATELGKVRNVLGEGKGDSTPTKLGLPLQLEGAGGEASYQAICHKWFELVCKGTPKPGDRHQSLYRLACDLRYITDFDPQLLARVIEECEVGRAIASERGRDEIERIAADACALQRYRTLPKRMQAVLSAVGLQLDGSGADTAAGRAPALDYEAWWRRLEPLLSDAPGYREAVAQLPEHHRLAGVLVAGAMFGTYLTRCWWEHFDGKDYRLSFLVYIVGSAASGKSFIVDLDRLIMAPMLAADRVGREWERQYREEMKKRAASTKNAKAEAPEQQHPVIRYVPSTISNAMLYRRLTDAIDDKAFGPDGQPMHLHCYTLEPELATALRAQTGSWAGKNDLELKSFHNEYAGVDYANDQSVNGIIQVNWNQIVSGTQEAMNRKVKPSMVLDGLVTRLALFPMPSNDYAMIERRKAIRDHEREAYLRSIGLKLEQVAGELKCERLVDFCYQYEKKLTDEARLEQDLCLDYFRKRIPVIMMRYTLVRIVLRSLPPAPSNWRGGSEVREAPEESAKGEEGEKVRSLPPAPSNWRGGNEVREGLRESSGEEEEKSGLDESRPLDNSLNDESNHNSCVPSVASDQRSSVQFSIFNSCVPAVASDQRSSAPLVVSDSDLEFARLIGDWCLTAQMHMFGEMVMEAQERERSNFVPRKRSTKMREAYASLPEELTTETLVMQGVAKDVKYASTILLRWLEDGLITKTDSKRYHKTYKEIPL